MIFSSVLSLLVALSSSAAAFANVSKMEACPTDIAASCAVTTADGTSCLDALTGLVPPAEFKASCEAEEGGVYSASPCSKEKLTSSCVLASEQGQSGIIMRLYQPLPAEIGAYVCQTAGGKLCE